MTLTEIITAGMNNPECSFFVGSFMGTLTVGKMLLVGFFLLIAYKYVDALALEPSVHWIKSKAKKSRSNTYTNVRGKK